MEMEPSEAVTQLPSLSPETADLLTALKELRQDANRLCDRGLGGTYEEDCRRSIAKVDAALLRIAASPQGPSNCICTPTELKMFGTPDPCCPASTHGSQEPEGTKMDKAQTGIYRKFDVRRTDGSDARGGKHDGCNYFVLDLTHDPHAIPAMKAYSESCRAAYPVLAQDIDTLVGQADSSSSWRPITSAPKDGTRVILFDGFWPQVAAGYFHPIQKWVCGETGANMHPTHWMPLPSPPASLDRPAQKPSKMAERIRSLNKAVDVMNGITSPEKPCGCNASAWCDRHRPAIFGGVATRPAQGGQE